MTAAPADPPPPAGRMPLGIYVLVVLRLVQALIFVLAAVGIREEIDRGLAGLLTESLPRELVEWLPAMLIVLAAISVVIAVGLLTGHRWGWVATMLVTGAGLAFSIWTYSTEGQNDLQLLLLVVSAFYLNQRVVRERYLGART